MLWHRIFPLIPQFRCAILKIKGEKLCTKDILTEFRICSQSAVSCYDNTIDVQRCCAKDFTSIVNFYGSQYLQVIAVDCDTIVMTAPELVVDVLQITNM